MFPEKSVFVPTVAELPENIARLSTIDQRHTGIARRSEGTSYLEDKDTCRVLLNVEFELPGQLGRGRETVHSWREG